MYNIFIMWTNYKESSGMMRVCRFVLQDLTDIIHKVTYNTVTLEENKYTCTTSVFEINCALGARRALCARCVHVFSAYCNTYTLGSALGKSRAHTLTSCAPERRTNNWLISNTVHVCSY